VTRSRFDLVPILLFFAGAIVSGFSRPIGLLLMLPFGIVWLIAIWGFLREVGHELRHAGWRKVVRGSLIIVGGITVYTLSAIELGGLRVSAFAIGLFVGVLGTLVYLSVSNKL
jgi:hypothetical protein